MLTPCSASATATRRLFTLIRKYEASICESLCRRQQFFADRLTRVYYMDLGDELWCEDDYSQDMIRRPANTIKSL